MGVYVRTGKRSGISVPWVLSPFFLMAVLAFWMLVGCAWITFMIAKGAVLLVISLWNGHKERQIAAEDQRESEKIPVA